MRKGKRVKMEMLADVETDTVGKDRKRSGGKERLYRRWPLPDRRGRECGKWVVRGMEVVERCTDHAAGHGRQQPRPITPNSSRPPEVHFPSITACHQPHLHGAQSTRAIPPWAAA
jgi:hypothetical protein